MTFALVCLAMLLVLGLIALVANVLDKSNDGITTGHDCSTCISADEGSCKIHCLIEEKKKAKGV